MATSQDEHYMASAISMAQNGVGKTAENPSVGCIIVRGGNVIARARTANSGRPHAEAVAIQQAGGSAKGAMLYVTLEPCAHHGKTPPCVDAIINAGVTRVVIGCVDPDPRTSGQSIKRWFFSRIQKKRPYITLKTASTLDGKIACASGESKWITGGLARRHAHLVRASHDAILVGIETVLADDPILTTRLNTNEYNHLKRIVLDRRMRLPSASKLAQSAKDVPVILFYESENESHAELKNMGVITHQISSCDDLDEIVRVLASGGVNQLLVEGGAKVHASFLKAGLCDELLIYRAPTILGNEAESCISDLNVEQLMDRLDLSNVQTRKLHPDTLEVYKKRIPQ